MCTVTIVPVSGGGSGAWRMACSRDESHGRAPALPPTPKTIGDLATLMPVDPSSGGTWVGVNEHGLALTLLNYNLPERPTDRDMSRGDVIPALLGLGTVAEVIDQAAAIQRQRMMPFRLVACDGRSLMLWRSTEPITQADVTDWAGDPVMYTSSGLGDHLVEGPRRELFDGWFGSNPADFVDQQLAFHRHQWPGREHLSVCMHRQDARTVSYTTIDVAAERVTMAYHPDRPDREADDVTATLERRLVGR